MSLLVIAAISISGVLEFEMCVGELCSIFFSQRQFERTGRFFMLKNALQPSSCCPNFAPGQWVWSLTRFFS